MKVRYFCAIALLVLSSGCVQEKRPVNLTIAKQRVKDYYESGRYDKELQQIVNRSIRHFKKISPTKKSTVIFDIDETVLSNYADEKSISFGYIPKLYHEWVIQADAPAIPQTKRLYNFLVDRGFTIIFLTGRKHDEYQATIRNLKNQGFLQFEKLIVRQPHEVTLTAKMYKTNRRKALTQEGYHIVGCIGDQTSDLEGACSGHRVKVPNYRYMIP